MSTSSPFAGLPLPANTDILNMNQAMGDYAQGADSLLVPRFADNAARDAVMIGITAGMMCAVNGVPQYYDGSAWNVFEDHVFVRKTSDTTRASTVTPTADPHLVLSLLGGYKWELSFYAFASSTTQGNNPGILLAISTAPALATTLKFVQGMGAIGGNIPTNGTARCDVGDLTPAASFSVGANSANSIMTLQRAILLCPSTTTVTVTWAQATSNVAATTLHSDSFLVARRLVSL